MKKQLNLLILMLLAIYALQAQNQRLVLAEGFSSATCGPCATQNPAWNTLLHANENIVTSIKYQMNWPAPGNDPMYHHNPVDNTARRNYYSVNSVPRAIINGNYFQGTPSQVNQTMLQTVANISSPFQVQLQHQLNDAQDTIFLTMLVKADAVVSGNMVAHIAVVEKHIHFVNPPGTNGERDFYNVMKALLPSRNGTSLPDFQPGEYVIIEAAWKLANVYNIEQLAAVGFVQDNSNKHVHQAARSSIQAIVPHYANDAAVKSILEYPKTNCSGLVSNPKVTIANHGSEPLSSAQIVASINDNEVYNEVWTGNLGFLDKATIDLGDLPFGIIALNELKIEITSTNGQDDEYPINTTKSVDFNGAPNTSGNLNLFLLLDNNPHEVTWELFNSEGEVVFSGGPYSTSGQHIIPINLNGVVDCYRFVIYDSGANGICCDNGVGYYGLIGPNGQPLFTGSSFGHMEIHEFGYGLVGLDDNISQTAVSIHPNPAQHSAAVNIILDKDAQIEISLLDLSGRQINSVNYGIVKAGTHNFSDWYVDLPKGLYMVQIREGQNMHNRKLVIR